MEYVEKLAPYFVIALLVAYGAMREVMVYRQRGLEDRRRTELELIALARNPTEANSLLEKHAERERPEVAEAKIHQNAEVSALLADSSGNLGRFPKRAG